MRRIFFVTLFLNGFSVHAQNIFSFNNCIEYTLKHHEQLQINNNNITLAKEKVKQAVSDYLPAVSGSVSAIENIKLQTTVISAGVLGPTAKDVQFGTKYNSTAAAAFTQTIYNQGTIATIKANKLNVELNALQKTQSEEDLTYNTAAAYFQVLIIRAQLKLLYADKANYEAMLTTLEYQLQKGVVIENDVDRIRVSLNTTQYQIEDAISHEKLAMNDLKNAMGMPLDVSLNIKDSIQYESFINPLADDSLKLEMLTKIKINQKQVDIQKANVKIAQASYLPTITAEGKFATQSLNNDFSKAFYSWNNYSYIGLSVNIPVFAGFKRRSMVAEEKLTLKNDIKQFDLNKESLQLQFENAGTSVVSSYSSYQTNKDNMALAKKVADVTNYQYQQGEASLTDYLNDDAAYKISQDNYLISVYNLLISQLNYQKSKGSLFAYINQIKEKNGE